MTHRYKHTQIGYAILALLGLVILIALAVSGICEFVAIGINLLAGSYPSALAVFAPLVVLIGAILILLPVMLICAVLFATMTIEISHTSLTWSFGPGLIHKAVPITEIDSVAIVKNPWSYGWGIHLTPHGWLYNVSGTTALEIRLKSGKKLRLGTDQPEELMQAIKKATS
jgi:hypothetical protein